MAIEFSCISCNKLLRVPDGSQGKSCQCPACGAVSTIPETPEARPIGKPPAASAKDDGQVTVTCPNCRYPLRCKPDLIGTKGQCKQCKHIFVIGDAQSHAAKPTGLVFSCPKCNQLFDGKAEMAGRKGRCHTCGEVFIIELRQATSSPASTIKLRSTSPQPRQSPAKSKPATSEGKKIQLVCPSCNSGLEVPGSAAGQKTACPHCQQLLQIPEVGKSTSGQAGTSIFDNPAEDIFSGLNVNAPQPQTSFGASSNPFDFSDTSSNSAQAGHLPYMYPQADASSYQPPGYPANHNPLDSYQSPYQSPSSSLLSSTDHVHGDRHWLRSIASWHKQLIWSFLLQLIVTGTMLLVVVLLPLIAGGNGNGPQSNLAMAVGVFTILMLVVVAGLSIWFLVSYVVLCLKLYDGGKAALFIVGYILGGCVPFLPLILLIVVVINANAKLREHGISVGFLGADLNSI